MALEIERKWVPEEKLVRNIISNYQPVQIEQGYLCREPVIRVRKEGTGCYLTYKGKGGMTHEEYNLPLTETAYASLIRKTEGAVIRKRRYKVFYRDLFPVYDTSLKGPEGELLMELDIFEGALRETCILEIEFDSECSANGFSAPAEFGTEVTGKKEYTNAYLSEKFQ